MEVRDANTHKNKHTNTQTHTNNKHKHKHKHHVPTPRTFQPHPIPPPLRVAAGDTWVQGMNGVRGREAIPGVVVLELVWE